MLDFASSRHQKRVILFMFYHDFAIFRLNFVIFYCLGDNFQGNISRILFKRPNGGDEFEKKSLILKVAPKNVARRQMAGSRNVFLREISMYDEVNKNLIFNWYTV